MQLALVVGELVPVAVGLLDDDLPLLEQALQEQVDLEFLVLGVHDADGDVLEVDEERDLAFAHRWLEGGCRSRHHRAVEVRVCAARAASLVNTAVRYTTRP